MPARAQSIEERPETFAFWYDAYQNLQTTKPSLTHIGNPTFVVNDDWHNTRELAQHKIKRLAYLSVYSSSQWALPVTGKSTLADMEHIMGPVAFYNTELLYPKIPPGMMLKDTSRPESPTYDSTELYFAACPSSQVVYQKVLSYVRQQMTQGASGIFIDNGYSDPNVAKRTCQSTRHRHVFSNTLTGAETFLLMVREIRKVVKSYNPRGFVMVNGTVPPGTHLGGAQLHNLVDGQLWESFLRTSLLGTKEHRVDWLYTYQMAIELEKAWMSTGRPHVYTLSYPFNRSEAYFCYATAKLCNLPWAAGVGISDSAHRKPEGRSGTFPELITIRLGSPKDKHQFGGIQHGTIYVREFDHGIVVVNASGQPTTWALPPSYSRAYDAWSKKSLSPVITQMDLPPESGRVLLTSAHE